MMLPRDSRRLQALKGYAGIKDMKFNGTHNGMSSDPSIRQANGISTTAFGHSQGAPTKGSHASIPVGVAA